MSHARHEQGDETLTGKHLIKLMRTEKVTIRELAARLDMPMTRVRFRRENGFAHNPLAASDWRFAITGKRNDYPHFRG